MTTLPMDFDLPPMYLVRQHLEASRITDLPAAMREALEASGALDAIRPRMSVAIGAGMDTNLIGRVSAGPNGTVKQLIDVRRIFARSLTEQSHGNASGLPLADVVHRRLEEAIDRDITYTNMLTSSSRGRLSFLPPVAPSDRQGIAWCLLTGEPPAAGPGGDSRKAAIARIKNTLELTTFWISEALIACTEANPTLEVVRGPEPLAFDAAGDLGPF